MNKKIYRIGKKGDNASCQTEADLTARAQRLRHEDDDFDFAELRQKLVERYSTLPR
mgnify:CR=1 FL=1